jgi:hypothetical protein
MKSQFLKIAGVKSEKAFYKKFPTEAAFFKAHPEAKKMANGGEQDRGQLKKLDDLTNFTNYNMPEAQFGLNLPDPFSFGKAAGALNTASPTSLGGLGAANSTASMIGGMRTAGTDASGLGKLFGEYTTKGTIGGANSTASMIGGMRTAGTDASGLGKLFGEYTTKGTIGGAAAKGTGSASGYLDAGKNILGGISALKQEKEVRKQAKQDAQLTDVMKQAALLPQEIIQREYVRPEDVIVQPGQLAPAYGTGTNILAAQYGASIGGNPTEIANTFAPNTIYTDMGYEPLNDTSRIKAYYHGGKMRKAAGGGIFDPNSGFGQFMGGQGGEVLGNIAERVGTGGRGPSGSSQLGKGIGQAAGTLVGGPVGSLIGGTLGSLVGGLFGKKGAKETERYQQQAGQNVSDIQYANIGVGLQNKYGSFMEDGGIAQTGKKLKVKEYSLPSDSSYYRNPYTENQPTAIYEFNDGKRTQFFEHPYNAYQEAYNRAYMDFMGQSSSSGRRIDYPSLTSNIYPGNIRTDARERGEIAARKAYMKDIQGMSLYDPESLYRAGMKGQITPQDTIGMTTYDRRIVEQGAAKSKKGKLEEGGYVSNDWTPQVITTFGEYKLKDLLQPPHDADMLRAGGHLRSYTPPSAQAMYTGREKFAMGGDLKVYRGDAETISYNPYLPEGGETIMFRGPSHDDGGMPIKYGSSPVEVEGGEPAVKLKDGGDGDTNLNVYGNLKISKLNAELLNNPKFADKKFKNVANDLSKGEAKSNKNIDKASNRIDNLDVLTPFDKLALDTNNAILQGENMKLKKYAQDKMDLAALQSAINDTAEENGLVADDLAKGKVMIDKSKGKTAKSGIALKKAQTGVEQKGSTFTYNGRTLDPNNPEDAIIIQQFRADVARNEKNIEAFRSNAKGDLSKSMEADEVVVSAPNYLTFEEWLQEYSPEDLIPGVNEQELFKQYQMHRYKYGASDYTALPQFQEPGAPVIDATMADRAKKKFNLNKTLDTLTPYLNEALPYLRGTNARPLPLSQITPELSVMGDREEPVYAQTLQPNLAVSFDIINPQADLNDVDAQVNAAIRAAGSDAAAQAAIITQAYEAKNKIKSRAEQANLANKLGIYNQNLQKLDETQLANLNIRDKQYVRQAQAKSNTKAQKLLAAQSISDKFAQNRQANNTLGIYENLYNYRFDQQGRAQNRNPLAQFTKPTVTNNLPIYDDQGNIIGFQQPGSNTKKTTSTNSRNGSIVKALKNL